MRYDTPVLVRDYLARKMMGMRSHLTGFDDAEEMTRRLRGIEGEKLMARMIEFMMRELGFTQGTRGDAYCSPISKALRKARNGCEMPQGLDH